MLRVFQDLTVPDYYLLIIIMIIMNLFRLFKKILLGVHEGHYVQKKTPKY